jgi:hypothetical protein
VQRLLSRVRILFQPAGLCRLFTGVNCRHDSTYRINAGVQWRRAVVRSIAWTIGVDAKKRRARNNLNRACFPEVAPKALSGRFAPNGRTASERNVEIDITFGLKTGSTGF